MPGHENQWIFPPEAILNTPSIQHGLTLAEERSRRAKGVNFIIQAAVMLKLPQNTIATASIYFHRYFMRTSLVTEKGGIHHYPIAATSLFLATKAEENCRKTKEIVICVAKVAQKNAALVIDEQSKEFWRWKDNILQLEEQMLETLTFDIHVESPYAPLSEFFRIFGLEDKTLRNTTWAFINDSTLTHLALIQPANDITVAALFFTLKRHDIQLPDDDDGRTWWVRLGGSAQKISQAMSVMYDLYEDNPLGKKDNPYERSPADSIEAKLERTRRKIENGNGVDSQSHSEVETPGLSGGIPSPEATTTKEQVNGNGVSKEDGELTPNGKAPSEKEVAESRLDGSSDEKLKEAANDPATHEHTTTDNAAPVTNGTSKESSPKRKASEMDEESAERNSPSKRPRLENGTSETKIENGTIENVPIVPTIPGGSTVQNGSKSDEEEEGELEE